MSKEPILTMQHIGKAYYGNQVLSDVNLKVYPGEIHALLGENGAGKSTLMNILFGMPVIHSTGGYEGQIMLDNTPLDIKSPLEAMQRGIGMVHQEFMLIPGYTITENIKLNREITKENVISKALKSRALKSLDFEAMNAEARKALNTLEMNIDEWVQVAGLPVGYMQFVEIAREIDKRNLHILVFDEPTAVLTESEAANLLNAMRKIANSGICILFITHRLDEVMEIADNITVLRDGQHVATKRRDDTNVTQLAELMVGRKIQAIAQKRPAAVQTPQVILSINNLKVHQPGEEVRNLSIEVHEGEILGIGGLAGQGKIGIANGIMGLYPSHGDVQLRGTPLPLNNPSAAIQHNLAFVSEDRREVGLLLDNSIEKNIAVTAIQNKGKFLKKYGFFHQIDQPAIRQHTLNMIRELDIRCTGPDQITRRLSGGNQQKVCVARALTLEPDVLFVSEPTRGIDVGAKKLVLDTLVKLNEELGMTIVMTSSELAELRSICHRIAIVSEGSIAGILRPEDSDADYGLMMAGEYDKLHPGKEGMR